MTSNHRPIGVIMTLLLCLAFPAHSRGQEEGRLPASVKALADLEYARAGEKRLLLDLYLPEPAAAPLPVVVWVHGGAWRGGSKDQTPALPLLRHGYAVASISYRLSQEARFPAQIHDCKAAIRWLRAHAREYRLDPDRFGVWGSSAGGHLVALLGTSGGVKVGGNAGVSSRVQAVCDWFGPTDFLQMQGHAPAGSPLNHDAPDSPESLLIGGPIQENRAKVARANPITYVTRDDPPFLIMHGDRDNLVPLHQSELLHQALQKARVPVTLVRLEGAGHGGPGFETPEVRQQVVEFFDQRLKAMRAD
jgi:acetyl esterase/lipase